MPLSHDSTHDDARLVEYLLGLLPEDETERLDEASIVNDDVAARLRVVEDDLVDAYIRDRLDDGTRCRFEAVYFGSPRRRQKVEFSKRFLAAVDRARPAPPAHDRPRLDNNVARIPLPRLGTDRHDWRRRWIAWRWPAAAAVLAIACAASAVQTARVQRALDEERRERAAIAARAQALEQQLDHARAIGGAASAALRIAHQDEAGEQPRTQVAAVRPRLVSAPIAVALYPQTRSAEPPPTINVAETADRVAFDLQLESADYARYRVTLNDPSTNREIWRADELTPHSSGDAIVLSPVVPGRRLERRPYAFEVVGVDARGGAEPVASYVFQVDRR